MLRAKERAANDGLPPWVRHEHDERYRFASRFVDGADVVDVACGDGTGTATYAEAGARSIHAFDVSEAAVESTRQRQLASVHVAVADGRALPLDDDSADVFITLETIEHIPEAERFVEEIARILRPGGVVVCSTPNRAVYSPGTPPDGKPWNPYHVKEFDLDELRESLGRKFVDLEYFGQNATNRYVARTLAALGRVLPFNLAVRLRQAGKLRLLLRDSPARHAVKPLDVDRPPEIFVIVAAKPGAAAEPRAATA